QTFPAEVRFDHTKLAGESFTLSSLTVPQQQTWVFTDVDYYGIIPPNGLFGPPTQLPDAALVGLVRFELLFAGTAPMKTEAKLISAYATAFQVPQDSSGWSWLQSPVGPRRVGGFGLYAKAQERLSVEAHILNRPKFPINKVGVNMHGFSIPSSMFEETWRRNMGTR
ncbi:MAG: hypothetical protein ACE5E4_13245, partial [Candidatus Binatia bacterium]